jgi:hypothetical protein
MTLRIYQIYDSIVDAPVTDGIVFEGTLEMADDTYGLHIDCTEADLIDWCKSGMFRVPTTTRITLRYRDFATEQDYVSYLASSTIQNFDSVLGIWTV